MFNTLPTASYSKLQVAGLPGRVSQGATWKLQGITPSIHPTVSLAFLWSNIFQASPSSGGEPCMWDGRCCPGPLWKARQAQPLPFSMTRTSAHKARHQSGSLCFSNCPSFIPWGEHPAALQRQADGDKVNACFSFPWVTHPSQLLRLTVLQRLQDSGATRFTKHNFFPSSLG